MTPPIHQRNRSHWALLLVLQFLAVFATYFFANKAKDEDSMVRHTFLVQLSLERLLLDLDNAETNQRGYLLTGEDIFVAPYREARSRMLEEIAALRRLTADNSRQQFALRSVGPLIEAKLNHLEENIALRRARRLDPALLQTRVDRGRAMSESIHSAVGEMRGEEERLLQNREFAFGRAALRFAWSIVLGDLVMVALVVFLYLGIRRYSAQVAQAGERLSLLNAELERRVEDRTSSLLASQQLLKTFVKHVPAAVAMFDREMHYLQASDRWCADYALSSETLLGRCHFDVFTDLPERWKDVIRRGLAGESLHASEDRWDRADGTQIWLHWEIRPWGRPDSEPEGILILAEDITERKRLDETFRQSEREMRALAAALLTAQEDERRRIARDLHDDVTQQLAFLSMEIGRLAAEPAGGNLLKDRLRSLQAQAVRISQEVRRLSHGLHPSVIEDFGLSTALEEFCDDFSRSQGIPIHFDGLIEDAGLSLDAASSLYRVAQESVHNAVKHAAASQVRVMLRRAGGNVELRIIDNGAGFSAETDHARAGLGVISMKERMRLIDGQFSITSRPGQGTEVFALVGISGEPHEAAANSAR